MDYLRRYLLPRAPYLLAALLVITAVSAGLDHDHSLSASDTGSKPCAACTMVQLLSTCVLLALVAVAALQVAPAPNLPSRPLPRLRWTLLSSAGRAPPAA